MRRSPSPLHALLALTLGSAALATTAHAEPTARELAEAAFSPERLGFSAGSATLSLELRDEAGRVLTRKLEARTRVDGPTRKMRLSFLEPVDQRGVELLLVERRGEDPLQYLWLPRSQELRRINGHDREGRLGGSDFSLADLEGKDLNQAEVTRLPDTELLGTPCYVLALTAKPNTKAPGGYSRVVAWVMKDGLLPVRIDFERPDKAGASQPVRRLEVKKLARVGKDKRLAPSRLVMTDLSRSTRTTLDLVAQNPDASFPDTLFRPESLGR